MAELQLWIRLHVATLVCLAPMQLVQPDPENQKCKTHKKQLKQS